MAYWVGYNKTGFGEVVRVRGYDSLIKTRKAAADYMKMNRYDWVTIFRNKDARYHIEILWNRKDRVTAERYDSKSGRFNVYVVDSSGKLRMM